MRIIIESTDSDNKSRAIREIDRDDLDVSEMLEEFCNLMLAFGFHHESVKAVIMDMAESYQDDQKGDKDDHND